MTSPPPSPSLSSSLPLTDLVRTAQESHSPSRHLQETKGFKLAHFNVRSLWPKIDSFKIWLSDLDLDVITISESWLNNLTPNNLLDLPDYEVIRSDRPSGSRGGGLITLLNKNKGIICDPTKLEKSFVMNKHAEIQAFQLKPGNIKKMAILNCYRPPSGNIDCFLGHLQSVLDQIDKLNEYELYICGDMNIDYGATNSPGFKKLKNLEAKYGLSQLIQSPTRCTATSNSILDLIFTTSNNICSASPMEVNLSDHEPVIVIRKSIKLKHPKVSFTCRSFHNYSRENFQSDLDNYDWMGSLLVLTLITCGRKWKRLSLKLLTLTAPLKLTLKEQLCHRG